MRQLSRLVKNAKPLIKPPPLTVESLRKQLPGMSPEDRKITQQLLSNESALKKALQDSETASGGSIKDLISSVMDSATSPSDFDASFWGSVRQLIKETSGRHNIDARIENVPLFVNLFQVAKQVEHEPLRSRMLYLLGSYIYRLKMLRFDPVNEAEYLDALAKSSQPIQAVSLWRSRKNRPDVADSVYWWDIGILYHLEAGLAYSANTLAREMLAKFDYISPRSACEIIKASKDKQVQQFWIDYLSIAKQYPETDDINAKQSIDPNQLVHVFHALVSSRNWELAQMFVEKMPNFDLEFPLTGSKKAPNGDLNDFASVAIQRYPELLTNNSFFTFWIIHHFRADNVSEALDILEVARSKEIRFTGPQAASILGKLHHHGCTEQAQQLVSEYDLPEVAVVHLEHLPHDAIPDYIESINCDLTPELAEKILETGGKINYPLLDICLSHGCWKYLWEIVRQRSRPDCPDPRSALEAMFKAETYYPTLNLFETILQALILNGDPEGAVAVLQYIQSKHQLCPNKLLLNSVQAATKHSHGMPLGEPSKGDLPWPRRGPLAQPVAVDTFAHLLGVDVEAAKKLANSWESDRAIAE